jgi:hypothetical protein
MGRKMVTLVDNLIFLIPSYKKRGEGNLYIFNAPPNKTPNIHNMQVLGLFSFLFLLDKKF